MQQNSEIWFWGIVTGGFETTSPSSSSEPIGLIGENEVSEGEVRVRQLHSKVQFMETSAKNAHNVEQVGCVQDVHLQQHEALNSFVST